MKRNIFIDKEKGSIIVILIIWCVFTFKMITLQIKVAFKNFPKIYSLNLEQKYKLIDGNFYNFIKFCELSIPENESIVFSVLPKEPVFRSHDWLIAEYFIGKGPYYLYPRKIFREKDAFSDIKYRIIFDIQSKSFNLIYK